MANYKIKRTYGDLNPMNFKVTYPSGKTLADVADAIFLVKPTNESPWADRLIEKTIVGGGISTSGTRMFIVQLESSDYDDLVIGQTYRAALFLRFNGDSDYNESVEQIFDFDVVQNFHNP